MKTVRQSVIVARPAEAMYRMVAESEHYPDFLPWCSAAKIHERTAERSVATLEIDYRGVKSSITTVNRTSPPDAIDLELVEGPFDRFLGQWRFVPLGSDGCRVEFTLEYAFATGALESLLAPMFGFVTETLIDHFVKRAESAG
jgi:ribosome-associated toxin RatA of RatAB toxin-antitoxin module